ncbi:MAG: hypothetical protein EA402_08425 [Planctomycetota bacterium]|nr:MAG: hypothetical protein EA402_08425 [Planctomycetota bacterium]
MTQQRILLTQAEAGMTLAEPVESLKQAVLCNTGTVLSDPLIHRLMLLGVKRVVVQGLPAPHLREPSANEVDAMLEQRFSRCDHIPLMKNLRDTIRRRLLQESL